MPNPRTLVLVAVAVALAAAAVARRLPGRWPPVLTAYGLGLGAGAFGLVPPGDRAIVQALVEACVGLAIPALLLGAGWRRLVGLGRAGLRAMVAVLAGALAAAALLQATGAATATQAALTLAIFTGGLANLQAAGLAPGVAPATLVAANLGDVVAGGGLFLAFTAGGYGLARRVLHVEAPPSQAAGPATAGLRPDGGLAADDDPPIGSVARRLAFALGLAAGCLGAGLGASALVRSAATPYPPVPLPQNLPPQGALPQNPLPQNLPPASPPSQNPPLLPPEFVILAVAAAAAIALASTRRAAGFAEAGAWLGEGLMLVFCVLVGALADFATVGPEALGWAMRMAAFVAIETAVSLWLARRMGTEAGAWLLALIGAVYSPAFVPPVAQAAGRRDAQATGIVVGLIGLAAATPLALLWVSWFD